MEQADKEIEEIIGQMKWLKDFRCCESRFEVLCKGRDIGMELFSRVHGIVR